MGNTKFRVSDMACEGCANTIRNALEGSSGISRVDVTVEDKLVDVEYDPTDVNLETVEGRIRDAGYTPERA